MIDQSKQDRQTVTPDGQPVQRLIEGVIIQSAVTQSDERGTICEISPLALAAHSSPLVYVYQITIRPGKVKGWHVHHLHDDRIFLSQGTVKVVLYDNRPQSPTYQMINEIYQTEMHRSVVVIPAYVFHAHQNVGNTDVLMISLPTLPYDHADPDVYRLPLDTDQIPYRFEPRLGW